MGARLGVRWGAIALGLMLAVGYGAASLAQTQNPAAPVAPTSADTTAPVDSALRPGFSDTPMPESAQTFAVPATQPPAGTGATSTSPGTANPAAASAVAANQAALDAIESSITISQQRADALRHEIEEMSGDRAKQNAALIAAGQRVKLAEIEVGAMEERMSAMVDAEKDVRSHLDGADTGIANMLAALQRISLNPPPALIVDPADALGSARSAILIAAIVPQLRAKADAVVLDLKHLSDIKTEAEKEQGQLKANYAVLEEEQLRIATLIEARRQGVAAASVELDAEQKEAETLGAKATSLKQLVAELTSKITAVGEAAGAAAAANSNAAAPPLPNAIRVALANTARTVPAIPFSSARGYLALPASGADVMDFGAGDGFGGISEGLSLSTRASAQVVAPADGWVMYKGPYLNYGQIVILNPGENYTIVLAGLDAISVNIGQFVLMGEPLGTMGSRTIGRTAATSAGVSQPTLYIELRKNDQPVDPSGWWAPQSNTTQSG